MWCTQLKLLQLAAVHAAAVADPTTAPGHLQIFSMYGDDPAGQQGIVNIRLNNVPYRIVAGSISWNFSSIDAGYKMFNMSAFIDIEEDGFVWHGRSGLAPDWQANIAATVQAARSDPLQ